MLWKSNQYKLHSAPGDAFLQAFVESIDNMTDRFACRFNCMSLF